MTIDWSAFTPWSALSGGVLIGVATAMFALLGGRIAGVSGIVGGLLQPARGEFGWRAAFVIGLVGAPLIYECIKSLPLVQVDAGSGALVAAGLLVGLGTRYASGCTSGHGICGLSRGSARSFAATATFMATGFITVLVLRHALRIWGF